MTVHPLLLCIPAFVSKLLPNSLHSFQFGFLFSKVVPVHKSGSFSRFVRHATDAQMSDRIMSGQ